ncbi:hypothetical protein, partial [Methylorubrum thiocyanatum]
MNEKTPIWRRATPRRTTAVSRMNSKLDRLEIVNAPTTSRAEVAVSNHAKRPARTSPVLAIRI